MDLLTPLIPYLKSGVDPVSFHLFIIYCALGLSFMFMFALDNRAANLSEKVSDHCSRLHAQLGRVNNHINHTRRRRPNMQWQQLNAPREFTVRLVDPRHWEQAGCFGGSTEATPLVPIVPSDFTAFTTCSFKVPSDKDTSDTSEITNNVTSQ